MKRAPTAPLLLAVTIFAFWAAAFVVWWASLWHLDVLVGFEAELPTITMLVSAGINSGIPFWIAAAFSVLVLYGMIRHFDSALLVSGWLLCLAVGLTLLATVAVTMPMVRMCGVFVPGWSSTFGATGNGISDDAAVSSGCGH